MEIMLTNFNARFASSILLSKIDDLFWEMFAKFQSF